MSTNSASRSAAARADVQLQAPDVRLEENMHADGLDEPEGLVIQKLGHHVQKDASSLPAETPNMPAGQGSGVTVPLPGQ